jgi:hypothetical protein
MIVESFSDCCQLIDEVGGEECLQFQQGHRNYATEDYEHSFFRHLHKNLSLSESFSDVLRI